MRDLANRRYSRLISARWNFSKVAGLMVTDAARSRFRATTNDNIPNTIRSDAFRFGALCRVRLSTVS